LKFRDPRRRTLCTHPLSLSLYRIHLSWLERESMLENGSNLKPFLTFAGASLGGNQTSKANCRCELCLRCDTHASLSRPRASSGCFVSLLSPMLCSALHAKWRRRRRVEPRPEESLQVCERERLSLALDVFRGCWPASTAGMIYSGGPFSATSSALHVSLLIWGA